MRIAFLAQFYLDQLSAKQHTNNSLLNLCIKNVQMHLCTQTIVWAHIFLGYVKCINFLIYVMQAILYHIIITSLAECTISFCPSAPIPAGSYVVCEVQYSIILMSKAAPSSLQVYWKLCGMQGMLLRAGKIYKIYMQGMQGMLERYTKRGSCCQGKQINDMEELERLIKTLLRRTSLWFLRFMLNQTYTISS